MKIRGEIVILTVLLVAGLTVTPALGSMSNARQRVITTANANPEEVTLVFVDCTNAVPIKKEVTIPRTEWISIRNELQAISTSGKSMKQTLRDQFTVLQDHHLISADVTVEKILSKTNGKIDTVKLQSLMQRMNSIPIINNSLFSAMSAIFFEIQNGTNAVFGLNTFINVIGFDIISIHKGYAINGIQTNGINSKSVPPGEYFGVMFGFFGYWFGEKISTGIYSHVTVAGLSIVTGWVPIPLNP
jgi:hypothetical protein